MFASATSGSLHTTSSVLDHAPQQRFDALATLCDIDVGIVDVVPKGAARLFRDRTEAGRRGARPRASVIASTVPPEMRSAS